MISLGFFLLAVSFSLCNARHCIGNCRFGATDSLMAKYMPHKLKVHSEYVKFLFERGPLPDSGPVACENGFAGEYPCHNVDLVAFASHNSTGSANFENNDIWGWTDPETGREYALVGQKEHTAVVDVTDGKIVTIALIKHTRSIWSDIKVYKNYMIVGDEGDIEVKPKIPSEGIIFFDLTRVRSMTGTHNVVKPDYIYKEGITSSHNVIINEDTGYLYVVGSKTCKGGLHVVNIQDPSSPQFTACFDHDGYTHDAQCVIYKGPDQKYNGREICFTYNEDTLTIVDVEDKDNMRNISRTSYIGHKYTHQGWLTEDQEYILLNDEYDEYKPNNFSNHSHTYLWNVKDLENPVHFADYFSPAKSIDHNLYVKGDKAYLSNYNSGLRVVDIKHVAMGKLNEIGYFDVHPEEDNIDFWGAWSSYPYFKSGNIIVNSIDRGLYILKESKKNAC